MNGLWHGRPWGRRRRLVTFVLVVALGPVLIAASPLSATVSYGTDVTLATTVHNDPAAWLRPGAANATTVMGGNNTSATVTTVATHSPLTDGVTAAVGDCTGCTAANLDADDDVVVSVEATGVLLDLQAIIESITVPAQDPWRNATDGLVVRYTGSATTAVDHDLQLWNLSSTSWQTLETENFAAETTMEATPPDASHFVASNGTVQARVAGPEGSTEYTLDADRLEVRFVTMNTTASWVGPLHMRGASDESGPMEITAVHVSVTNAARIDRVAWSVGGTRLALYANATVEESGSTWAALAIGGNETLTLDANVTGGIAGADWVVDLAVRPSSGDAPWQTRYRVTANFTATQ